ncbi:MAG: hypothetical protein R3231_01285 [bacterium]|nr:hypothetical protein [bacterium]
MGIVNSQFWTGTLPDREQEMDPPLWRAQGGKRIVFDDKANIEILSKKRAPFIQSGQVDSAKYWNRDPSAICVYSLDREKEQVARILVRLGTSRYRAWQVDYAGDKNLQQPLNLVYSQLSKFRTILKSDGCAGTLGLMQAFLTVGQSRPTSGGMDHG